MILLELSENKKPRFYNRGFFATPIEQTVLPWPTYMFKRISSDFVAKLQRIC